MSKNRQQQVKNPVLTVIICELNLGAAQIDENWK